MSVPAGFKASEVGAIPQDWEVKQLVEVSDCLDRFRVPLNGTQRLRMTGSIPYCGANGIVDYVDDFVIDDDVILIAEDGGYFDEFLHRPIAYRMSGKMWVNNHAHILKAKRGTVQDYLFWQLVHKDITAHIASGTRAKLNRSELNKIACAFPVRVSEQASIAEALSSVDEAIAALEAVSAKKRGLKTGTAQALLSGTLRLPGFSEEWEVKAIDKICPMQRGFDLPTSQIRAGNVPVVYSNGISAYHNKAMVEGPGVVTGRSGTIGNVHYVGEDFWPHNTSLWVTSFCGNDPKFILYFLRNLNLARFASGSGVPTLNRNDFHNFEVKMPKPEEQISIAAVLSAIDVDLTASVKRLTKLRDVKGGMLQQLLTGRIRLV